MTIIHSAPTVVRWLGPTAISAVLLVMLGASAASNAADVPAKDAPAKTVLKTESFDHDPGWDAMNNRVVPKAYPTIVQDFGYSQTHFAGKAAGEIGGQVTRAAAPAYYAAKIGPTTLDDKLSASGSFAVTKTTP